MNNPIAYIADGIFTGEHWLPAHAVLVRDNRVAGLVPVTEIASGFEVIRYHNAVIAPAFIDIQLYGASHRLFSEYPEPESLVKLDAHNRAGGTVLCLPTIATSSNEVYYKAIDATRLYWEQGGKGIFGLHLEGPWINALRRGAHAERFIEQPSAANVMALLEYGKGVIRMITLAPELCSTEVLDLISDAGIIISAGHSDASYAQATDAFNNGIPAVTHLFNAMSPLHHRATGLPGAAMDHTSVMASIIPDGIHVDYSTVRIAKKIMQERLFVITDSVTSTTTGPYRHVKAGNKYESDGILSGSALQMNDAVRNLVEHVNITMDEALRMCSLYPARLLGKDGHAGMLREGYEASMVVLDKNFNVIDLVS